MVKVRYLPVKETFLYFIIFLLFCAFFSLGSPSFGMEKQEKYDPSWEQRVTTWRKNRDLFFKTHQRSPLLPEDKKRFKSLEYFPFDHRYVFTGTLERFLLHINDPQYYATFLTNQGTNKRYVRYGKFLFHQDGKDFVLEIFKSILSDTLFIPFKDLTNGKGTYDGGRYLDAEILPGYKMVLDFNQAYNPSCAYNSKFVCALPSQENVLGASIRAGEKQFKPSGKSKK